MEHFYKQVYDAGILPVIRLEDAGCAIPLAEALMEGGVMAAEITLRTEAAFTAIEAIAKRYPEMLLGAGTVRTEAQVKQAVNAGATFLVSPGSNPAVIRQALELNIPMLPGAVTPTELEIGLAMGCTVFKFFPCDSYGGIKTIKALCAPYAEVRFVPTGGIDLDNLGEYLACKYILAAGGSFVAPTRLIDEGDFASIKRLAKKAAAIRNLTRA